MRLSSKTPFGADEIVICGIPISGNDPATGSPVTIGMREKVRGDHFLVKLHPECFAREGEALPSPFAETTRFLVAEDNTKRRLRESEEEHERQRNPAKFIPPNTPISQLAKCHTQIVDSRWGRCGRGEVRLKTDPIVLNLPEYFGEFRLT